MSQVIASVTANPFGVLSGPSFAAEVAAGMPTAIVAAGTPAVSQAIQRAFSSPTLRIYTNEDVTGVELGGALKNVIALAAGVVHGLDLGYNPAAALGLAARYGVEMPITEQMDAILHRGKSPKVAIHELMTRPGKDE